MHVIFLTPGEDGLFACNSNTIVLIDLILFTQEALYLWLGPAIRISGSGYGLKNLLKDSSQLRDRTKYSIIVRHDDKRVL